MATAIQKYYGKNGVYLKEHKDYFSDQNLKRDAEFIIQALKLTKNDKCLDLQCAQGRITVELASRGYNVDGLDLSKYMVDLAKKSAKKKNLNIDFFIQDINDLKLPAKYTKVLLFFPDWTDLDFEKVMPNISKIIKRGDRYYTFPELENIFRQNGLKIIAIYGNWTIQNSGYNYNSPRLRIVAKKI